MRRMFLILPAVLAVFAAACASGDDSADDTDATPGQSADGTFPVTVEADNGSVTIDAEPTAIVSLSPTATETLFAIGADDQVVAVDDNSNFPDDTPVTDLSGFEPNVEAIAAFDPHLVVASDDPGDLASGLDALSIPVLIQPPAATIDDAYDQIEHLGAASGHVGEAAELRAQIQTDLDELVASVPDRDQPLTYYHELDDTYFSATSSTFIGQLYELAGLVNIADPADDGSGFPQLSAEFVVEQDPDFVFLADTKCCGQNAETVASRPGWGDLTAITEGQVVELDDDVASRWGPRIVDFLSVVVEETSG